MEEKEILYEDEEGEREAIAIFEEGVGVTIVNKYDKDHYFLCIPGKNSPLYKNFGENFDLEKGFDFLVNQILNGKVNGIEAETIIRKKEKMGSGGYLSSENCSFQQ